MNTWERRRASREDLEEEIRSLRAAEEERREREEAQREQERREREEERREAMHRADDWPEAFRKQYQLIGPELHFSEKELARTDIQYDDPAEKERDLAFWREDVQNLKNDLANIAVAERIYAEEAPKAQAEIKAAVAAIRQRMLATVIERLKPLATSASRGFTTELIEAMERDDPSAWLNW